MKVYVDSDGVLADFHKWALSKDERAIENVSVMERLIIDNYKECYLVSDVLNEKSLLLDLVANDSDYFVLTAVGRPERFSEYCPEKSLEELAEIVKVLTENKYKWFENHGVPREKVIIVGKAREKLNYCTPDSILYDDWQKTVDEWNEAGGIGIRVYNKYRD